MQKIELDESKKTLVIEGDLAVANVYLEGAESKFMVHQTYGVPEIDSTGITNDIDETVKALSVLFEYDDEDIRTELLKLESLR